MSVEHATAVAPAAQAVLGGGLLDRIVEESRVAQSEQEKSRARDIIGELVSQVLEGEVVVSENLAASIDARVAELDRLLPRQLQQRRLAGAVGDAQRAGAQAALLHGTRYTTRLHSKQVRPCWCWALARNRQHRRLSLLSKAAPIWPRAAL